MTGLDPNYEKKVLLDVVEQMKDPDVTERKQATLKRILLGLGWVLLFTAFFLGLNELVHAVAVAFIAGMGGAAIGFGQYLGFAQKQWPVTKKHIDMASVEKRLDELES